MVRQLRCSLCCQHPLSEPQFEFQLLRFRSSSLVTYLQKQQKMVKWLGPCHPSGRPQWNSFVTTSLAWPRLSPLVGIPRVNQQLVNPSVSFSLLSLELSLALPLQTLSTYTYNKPTHKMTAQVTAEKIVPNMPEADTSSYPGRETRRSESRDWIRNLSQK